MFTELFSAESARTYSSVSGDHLQGTGYARSRLDTANGWLPKGRVAPSTKFRHTHTYTQRSQTHAEHTRVAHAGQLNAHHIYSGHHLAQHAAPQTHVPRCACSAVCVCCVCAVAACAVSGGLHIRGALRSIFRERSTERVLRQNKHSTQRECTYTSVHTHTSVCWTAQVSRAMDVHGSRVNAAGVRCSSPRPG